jgi:hypothetical protein
MQQLGSYDIGQHYAIEESGKSVNVPDQNEVNELGPHPRRSVDSTAQGLSNVLDVTTNILDRDVVPDFVGLQKPVDS